MHRSGFGPVGAFEGSGKSAVIIEKNGAARQD
jgi:hypothetical protein